jgi:hypothetical protein
MTMSRMTAPARMSFIRMFCHHIFARSFWPAFWNLSACAETLNRSGICPPAQKPCVALSPKPYTLKWAQEEGIPGLPADWSTAPVAALSVSAFCLDCATRPRHGRHAMAEAQGLSISVRVPSHECLP